MEKPIGEASQKVPGFRRARSFIGVIISESLLLASVQSLMNPFRAFWYCFFTIHCNMLPSMSRPSKRAPSFKFTNQEPVCASFFSPHMLPNRCLTPKAGFVPMEVVVGFVVNKVTVRQVFSEHLSFQRPIPYFTYLPSTPCYITNWQRHYIKLTYVCSYLCVTDVYNMLCHFYPF
jgi:hypothetical protein